MGPYFGPQIEGPVEAWAWKDIYRWDPEKQMFIEFNNAYPEFYRHLRKEYEAVLEKIGSRDVPGFSWSHFEKSFLELKTAIENDYLPRIDEILRCQ